jgi:hypothetical protein
VFSVHPYSSALNPYLFRRATRADATPANITPESPADFIGMRNNHFDAGYPTLLADLLLIYREARRQGAAAS